MKQTRWDQLLGAFGIPSEQQVYGELITAYSEKHRAYHTQTHINDCLHRLDGCALTIDRVHELEMAFWFHDAIYQIYSGTNEEDSAAWAVRFLQDKQIDNSVISRVNQYILDTKHNVVTTNLNAGIVVDIDLAILGSEPAQYEEFELAIAREYRIVPKLIYRKKRKQVLRSFLDRADIYQTEHYRQLLEIQARSNLAWAIEQLS